MLLVLVALATHSCGLLGLFRAFPSSSLFAYLPSNLADTHLLVLCSINLATFSTSLGNPDLLSQKLDFWVRQGDDLFHGTLLHNFVGLELAPNQDHRFQSAHPLHRPLTQVLQEVLYIYFLILLLALVLF